VENLDPVGAGGVPTPAHRAAAGGIIMGRVFKARRISDQLVSVVRVATFRSPTPGQVCNK
jgi:hypothetical protein